MKDFFVVVGAYKEESAGQIKELTEAVERFRLPNFYARAEIDKMDATALTYSDTEAKIGDLDKLVFLDKEKNPDLILAARHLLAFGAKGAIILFGNNENRDYIREGKAYTAREVREFAGEVIRLLPLFQRRLV